MKMNPEYLSFWIGNLEDVTIEWWRTWSNATEESEKKKRFVIRRLGKEKEFQKPLAEITTRLIKDWVDRLLDDGLKLSTSRVNLSCLAHIFRAAGVPVDDNPALMVLDDMNTTPAENKRCLSHPTEKKVQRNHKWNRATRSKQNKLDFPGPEPEPNPQPLPPESEKLKHLPPEVHITTVIHVGEFGTPSKVQTVFGALEPAMLDAIIFVAVTSNESKDKKVTAAIMIQGR